MLHFDFTLERDPKNIFHYQPDVENDQTRSSIFYYMIDMNIYTREMRDENTEISCDLILTDQNLCILDFGHLLVKITCGFLENVIVL